MQYCLGFPATTILSQLSHPCYHVQAASLSSLSCPGWSVPAVLLRMFCRDCTVLAVLSRLSRLFCSKCPVPAVLSVCPVLVVISWLSCRNLSIPAVLLLLPVLMALGSLYIAVLSVVNQLFSDYSLTLSKDNAFKYLASQHFQQWALSNISTVKAFEVDDSNFWKVRAFKFCDVNTFKS